MATQPIAAPVQQPIPSGLEHPLGPGCTPAQRLRRERYLSSAIALADFLQRIEDEPTLLTGAVVTRRRALPPVIICCVHCGKPALKQAFDILKSIKRGHKDLYCSQDCCQAHHAVKNTPPCRTCGKPAKLNGARRYCSDACKVQARKQRQRPPVLATCPQCTKPFVMGRHKRKFCSVSCADMHHSQAMLLDNNPNYQHGHFGLRRQPHTIKAFTRARPQIRRRDGNRCVACDAAQTKGNLHVHHIDHDPHNCAWNNLVTLCASCHLKHHRHARATGQALFPWLADYARKASAAGTVPYEGVSEGPAVMVLMLPGQGPCGGFVGRRGLPVETAWLATSAIEPYPFVRDDLRMPRRASVLLHPAPF